MSETGSLFAVVHWRSVLGERPLCGAQGDQPSTQLRHEVTCLACLGHLEEARKRARRRSGGGE